MKVKVIMILVLSFTLLTGVVYGDKIEFDDLTNHWARNSIMELVNMGLVEGVSHNKIAPNDNITRVQFTVLMTRALGENYSNSSGERWYSNGYNYALENNLVPSWLESEIHNPITREEMMEVVYRFYLHTNKNQVNLKPSKDLMQFKDYNKVDSSFLQAVIWSLEQELIKGRDNQELSPKGFLTRAEGMVVLNRFIHKFEHSLHKDEVNSQGEDVAYKIEKLDNDRIKVTLGWGEKPTGGYRILIKDVVIKNKEINIEYLTYYPKEDAMVTQAITYPKDSRIIKLEDYNDEYRVILINARS